MNTISKFIKHFVCDSKNKKCVYRECVKCKNKEVKNIENDKISYFFEWVTKKKQRIGSNNNTFNVTFIVKKKIICTVTEMINKINVLISVFFKHAYDTYHQLDSLRNNKINLKATEVQVVDFSDPITNVYIFTQISSDNTASQKKS